MLRFFFETRLEKTIFSECFNTRLDSIKPAQSQRLRVARRQNSALKLQNIHFISLRSHVTFEALTYYTYKSR